MDIKDAYQHKIQAELHEWQTEIDRLKAKANRVGTVQKLRYYEELESLRVKHRTLQKKLNQLSTTSEDAWNDIKTGVDAAWHELRHSLDSANEKLK